MPGTTSREKGGAKSKAKSASAKTGGGGKLQSPNESASQPKKDVGRRGRSNGGGTDANGESNVRGEP